jgi:superfamily II DNA helicase RecQ
MVPSSLSILTQHFGRGGRSGEPTVAILLVETSVYQVKSKESESRDNHDEDDDNNDNDDHDHENGGEGNDEGNSNNNDKVGPSYRKKIDDNLRIYISASECRRRISNEYFRNPARTARKFIPVV